RTPASVPWWTHDSSARPLASPASNTSTPKPAASTARRAPSTHGRVVGNTLAPTRGCATPVGAVARTNGIAARRAAGRPGGRSGRAWGGSGRAGRWVGYRPRYATRHQAGGNEEGRHVSGRSDLPASGRFRSGGAGDGREGEHSGSPHPERAGDG